MALTQLTKVDGGGISTTSDYRVGVITASKFVGPFDGSAGNFSGIITATGANFSGNVSIGGTLTYEDVTNIDSVGIITAQKDIHVGAGVSVVGIVTAATGDFFDLDVDGHTNLDNVSIAGITTGTIFKVPDSTNSAGATNNITIGNAADLTLYHNGTDSRIDNRTGNLQIRSNGGVNIEGATSGGNADFLKGYSTGDRRVELYNSDIVRLTTTTAGVNVSGTTTTTGLAVTGVSTFTGNIDANGDLDVDGHTNLDNINIAGVTTASGNISVVKSSGVANLSLVSGDNYATIEVGGQTGAFIDLKSPASDDYDVRFTHDGFIYAKTNISISPNAGYVVNVNKKLNCTEDLDVDGHTNLDNVSVAGISTFSDHINLPDNKQIKFGGSSDFKIEHNTNENYIDSNSGHIYIRANVNDDEGDNIIIQAMSGEDSIKAIHDGAVELYHDGGLRLSTTSTGVSFNDLNITNVGTIACDSLKGDADDNTNITFAGSDVITFKAGTTSPALTINTTQVKVEDGHYIVAGTGNDFKISHSSSGSGADTIDSSSGYFYINSDALRLNSRTSAWNYLRGDKSDGVVKLYKSNSQRLATSDTGITVTGEVAASQDYPDLKPSLDLNFAATKKLDPRIKFARQGVASYYDANGNVKFAADNEPRFDHDPDTGECKGLLIEEASINLIAGSADEGSDTRSVYSTLGNGFAINELVSDVIRPTGTPGLVRRVKSHASSNSGGRWGGYSGSGGSPYAGSFWARSVTGTSQVGIDVNDVGYNVTTLTTKWVRVEAVGTTGNNYDFMDISLPNTSDDIYIWGMQLEQNEYASSYIRNSKNSTQAYRGADTAYIDGESFDEFYNQSEGTMVSSHSLLPNVSATQNCYTYQVAPDTGTSEAPFRLIDRNSAYGNSLGATSINSNSNVAFFRASGNPVTVANVKMKVAFAIKKDDFAASFNGGATSTDTSGALSETSDHLSIGYYKPSPQAYLNGHIQRLTYYPKRLSNTQLQNLSS